MKKIYLVCGLILSFNAHSEVLPLDDALRATYVACVGIDDKLSEYKTLAGINTAVSAVGTGLGVGATSVGIIKYATDKEADSYEKILEELREQTKDVDYDQEQSEEEIEAFEREFNLSYDAALNDVDKYQSELDNLNKKSKKLGNWRTGLLASATVTNVAGVILSSKSGADGQIQDMIDGCLIAVDNLTDSALQAKFNGEDVSEANEIIAACREYKTVDATPIAKRAKGGEISSAVGATTGLVGTVVSATANTDKVRNDNTDKGKKKEKNLNTVANVMAGTTTVASAATTVFSATQIAAIKKVAKVAEQCEGVLR